MAMQKSIFSIATVVSVISPSQCKITIVVLCIFACSLPALFRNLRHELWTGRIGVRGWF